MYGRGGYEFMSVSEPEGSHFSSCNCNSWGVLGNEDQNSRISGTSHAISMPWSLLLSPTYKDNQCGIATQASYPIVQA